MNKENVLFEEGLQQELTQEDAVQEELTEQPAQEEEVVAAEPAEGEEQQESLEEGAEDAPEAAEGAASEEGEAPEEEEIDLAAEITKKAPYHDRYSLKYCEGKRTAPLDIAGTKNFLQSIGFDGGELRQAREKKGTSEVFQNHDKNKTNQMFCSYCGSEISGVEYYRLPDGRLRCTTCSRSIVSDKEEIQEICSRVIANMDNFFRATIDVPVSIEVVDEIKLKKKMGLPLGEKDTQSMLILGVAINKKKKYKIILENGAPRISLIATFAHELTHIWQYTHWDNNKNLKQCANSKRLIIYEGMAKWAEIQYLYLIGETNVARREEFITRNREDEYGAGFRLYEDYYKLTREAMTCESTPFTPNSYPFD